MAVIYTGDRVSQWGTWQGPGPDGPANNGTAEDREARRFDDFTAVPPDPRWDRSIRMKRFQGDYSQWIVADEGSLSRAQLQGPSTVSGTPVYPIGSMRWSEWWVRFNSVAVRVSDDFHMYVESHTPSANPGGVWAGNLSENPTVVKMRRWVGPGSFTHIWVGETPLDLGGWNHHILGCIHATGTTGALHYYVNGELLYSATNTATTTQSGNHYPEIGFYTYWSVTGTDDMNIAGFQVTDTQPSYPGESGGEPIDTVGFQNFSVVGRQMTASSGVHYANDPDRVTPSGRALSPAGWRRRGRIYVPCNLPIGARLWP